jgi:hypothetical protein
MKQRKLSFKPIYKLSILLATIDGLVERSLSLFSGISQFLNQHSLGVGVGVAKDSIPTRQFSHNVRITPNIMRDRIISDRGGGGIARNGDR